VSGGEVQATVPAAEVLAASQGSQGACRAVAGGAAAGRLRSGWQGRGLDGESRLHGASHKAYAKGHRKHTLTCLFAARANCASYALLVQLRS